MKDKKYPNIYDPEGLHWGYEKKFKEYRPDWNRRNPPKIDVKWKGKKGAKKNEK